MSLPLFLKDPSEYDRTFDLLGMAREQTARYFSVKRGISFEDALARYDELVGEGKMFQPRAPTLNCLTRKQALGDRAYSQIPVDKFFENVERTGRILSPSFICYENPEVHRAFEADLIDGNLIARSKIKKEGFLAEQRGDHVAADFADGAQSNKKTLNNSLSGAAGSPHNSFFCPSAHTTLTSTTRTLTSNSNSITERLIGGGRHYFDADVTMEALATAITYCDEAQIADTMAKYDIPYPTLEYVFSRIEKMSDIYWKSKKYLGSIRDTLEKMSPSQLALFIYNTDLRSFIEVAPDFTRRLFDDLTLKGLSITPLDLETSKEVIDNCDDYLLSYGSTLSFEDIVGGSLRDLAGKDAESYGRVAGRIQTVKDLVLGQYWQFFETFFITELIPAHIHSFPQSLRKVVAGSDTDSTLYTCQTVIEWYFGKLDFSQHADNVRELTTYIDSQVICHTLAKICKQLGVVDKDLFRLKMKPEFSFPVMGFTNRMKHYWVVISAQEGNFKLHPEYEFKGVALKSSKVSNWIIKISNRCVEMFVEAMKTGNKLTPLEAVAPVAYLEHKLLADLRGGKSGALYNLRIKDPGAYSQGRDAPAVKQFDLWEEVFAPKYGSMGQFPIDCKKVPVNLPNITALKKWINSLPEDMRARAESWAERTGRKDITYISVPTLFLVNYPIPDEIWAVFNKSQFFTSTLESFYYNLEIVGLYIKNGPLTRFAHEEVSMELARDNLLFDVDAMIK